MSYLGSDVGPTLREIERLALADGNTDFAWVATFLNGREDFATGALFQDDELARLPAGENIRVGLRDLHERGLLEVRIERQGHPWMTWIVFVPEAHGQDRSPTVTA